MSKRRTHEEFVEEVISINSDILEFEFVTKFSKLNEYMTLKNKYGEIRVLASNLIRGKTPTIQSAVNKTSYWINMIDEKFGRRYDYSKVEYNNNMDKVVIICHKHGEFLQSPNKHLMGRGCPECRHDTAREQFSSNHEEFIAKLKERNPEALSRLKFVDEYINRDTYMLAESKYGIVRVKPGKLLGGRLFTIESAIDKTKYVKNQFREANGDLYGYESVVYVSDRDNVKILCHTHGIFECTPGNHKKGKGCPKCKTSKGELEILYILEKFKIDYKAQKKFDECVHERPLRFDFYLKSYNTAIEYDGEGHFSPVDFAGNGDDWANEIFELNMIRDSIKDEYCKKNNIKLLRIPYWDFENIEDILKKELNLKE